jgi:predicted  nucleic acid-binding Zn-ribbon protein
MSDNERPESHAVAELDLLVRHLADELAAFRRRALTAESKLKEVESQEGGAVALDLSSRVATLERENERLQNRLDEATARAKQMLERVRFLRQQARGGER